MGDCVYCGKPAGFFKSRHAECQSIELDRLTAEYAAKERSKCSVREISTQLLEGRVSAESLLTAVKQAEDSGIPAREIRDILINQWTRSIDKSLEDGVIDTAELSRLTGFLEAMSISKDEVDTNGHFRRMVKGVVLHELFSGTLPQRFSFSDRPPVNLQKEERIVWGFQNTKYIETRTRIDRVGSSQGVSVRIMSGVYYRVGSFKSQPVEKTEHRHIDTGWMIFTDKNFYFVGQAKSQRIPYSKIISIDPYSDGIGIMRDAASAKPQLFINNDGWFAYNLLTNLAQR